MIKLKGVGKRFNQVVALDQVDLEIKPGPPTGLVGPNGAGKTTLFSLLCGFLRPTSGSISIMGHPPLANALHGKIAILPQDAGMTKGITVIKHLTFLAELQGYSRREARIQATEALKHVNLSDAVNRMPDQLSHGMLKRVAIAQALMGEPELVMLDEPTAGLDPNTVAPIRELVRARGDHIKFIVSSHNLKDIEDLCGDLIILKKGRVTEHSQVREMLSRSRALTFRLEHAAPDDIESFFEDIMEVSDVQVSGADRRQLYVQFDSKSETEAQVNILQCLQSNGIIFVDMTRGESLESKVRKITDN